jgi:hypothetical protein
MTRVSISKFASQIGKWLLPACGLAYVLSLFFPWISGPPVSVDQSWELALHWAAERHLQFGQDIIFTFGPWGILYGGYYPPTHVLCASIWMLLALVFWWLGWRVASHFAKNQLVAWIWFMLFAGLAGMRVEQSVDVRVTGYSLLMLTLYFFVENKPVSARQMVLAFVAGILALIKFTCFIQFGVVFAVIGADVVLRHRRIPWIWAAYLAGILFFWMAAGQHLANIGLYLRYSVMLAGGYTQAMMLSGDDENVVLIGMLLSMLFFLAVLGGTAWKPHRFYSVLVLAGFGGVFFLMFKLGSVRFHSVHGITTTLQLMLILLVCLAVTWPVLKNQKWGVPGATYAAFAGIFLFGSWNFARAYREQGFSDEQLWVDYAWTLNGHNLATPVKLIGDHDYLQKIYQKNLAVVCEQFPLPPLRGNVDVYSWRQAVIFANGLTYNPRPIIQSYSACTPKLAELNVAHLRGAQAPDNVLFDINPQNHSYPSLEDGPSWPELLVRYNIAGTTPGFVILKKASPARDYHLIPLTNEWVAIGSPLTIATNPGLIWAELEIRPSFQGVLASIFYKPDRLWLAVTLKNGEQRRYNLVAGMARAGFVLSPLIADKNSFISLATGNAARDLDGLQVESVAVISTGQNGGTSDYRPQIRWQLFRLDFPPQKLE